MLHEFLQNFLHNLFKPLLLFFYFGFLLRILKVDFEFPYVIYQGLTMYLLVAIGWHGGEELAEIKASSIGQIVGFLATGFCLNFVIGLLAYLLLSRLTALRQVDKATVAGYYASDSAGTFATCVAVLTGMGIAFNAYMPVMLAVMEVPGCLVALYLVARLRHKGMDVDGNMPDEPGYIAPVPARVGPGAAAQPAPGQELDIEPDDRGAGAVRAGEAPPSREADRRKGGYPVPPVAAGGLPQSGTVSALRRHRHRVRQRVAGTQSHSRRRLVIHHRVSGRALPVLARDGHDSRQ